MCSHIRHTRDGSLSRLQTRRACIKIGRVDEVMESFYQYPRNYLIAAEFSSIYNKPSNDLMSTLLVPVCTMVTCWSCCLFLACPTMTTMQDSSGMNNMLKLANFGTNHGRIVKSGVIKWHVAYATQHQPVCTLCQMVPTTIVKFNLHRKYSRYHCKSTTNVLSTTLTIILLKLAFFPMLITFQLMQTWLVLVSRHFAAKQCCVGSYSTSDIFHKVVSRERIYQLVIYAWHLVV